jgi:hypothetical protein
VGAADRLNSAAVPLSCCVMWMVPARVLGVAIMEARDAILARRAAEAAGIGHPGAPALADQLDPASVPRDLIGRKLTLDDLPIKKPPAPSVRRARRARREARAAR